MQTMPFATACKNYFGFKEGQNSGGFLAELKALTPKDKADFIAMFPSVGITITTSV
jgi:hypothetical protein